MPVPDNDTELMARIVTGEHQAFALLLDRHLERVRAIAWRLLHNHADTDDVAQEVFIKLWQNPTSFDPAKAKFSTWLYRVTINAAIDRQRATKRRAHEPIPDTMTDTAPTPEQNANDSQRAQRVSAEIARLPDRQKQAITLTHFEGLTNIETAEVLETSVEAVESLLSRARRTLKFRLKPQIKALMTD